MKVTRLLLCKYFNTNTNTAYKSVSLPFFFTHPPSDYHPSSQDPSATIKKAMLAFPPLNIWPTDVNSILPPPRYRFVTPGKEQLIQA